MNPVNLNDSIEFGGGAKKNVNVSVPGPGSDDESGYRRSNRTLAQAKSKPGISSAVKDSG